MWHEATNCIPKGPPHPSKLDKAVTGDLFIIRGRPDDDVQSWLLTEDGKWKRVKAGYRRPGGRYLKFSDKKQEPSFVKEAWFKHGR